MNKIQLRTKVWSKIAYRPLQKKTLLTWVMCPWNADKWWKFWGYAQNLCCYWRAVGTGGQSPPPSSFRNSINLPYSCQIHIPARESSGFSDLPTVLCCNLAIWIWECIWEEVKKKTFSKLRSEFFFKSSLNREWYVCDIFFLSRKKWKGIHNRI